MLCSLASHTEEEFLNLCLVEDMSKDFYEDSLQMIVIFGNYDKNVRLVTTGGKRPNSQLSSLLNKTI